MQAHYIVAGFSDIKSEFLEKTKIAKTIKDLSLWFTFEDDVLYAHDFLDHNVCIVIAIYSSDKNSWNILLKEKGYGYRLVQYLIGLSSRDKLMKAFNEYYRSYGFSPFGR